MSQGKTIIYYTFRSFGALGAGLTPMIVYNLPYVDYIVPIVVIIVTQLYIFLPPTLNKKLPATYEQASDLKNESKLSCTY